MEARIASEFLGGRAKTEIAGALPTSWPVRSPEPRLHWLKVESAMCAFHLTRVLCNEDTYCIRLRPPLIAIPREWTVA
jgi:hypothetical protein